MPIVNLIYFFRIATVSHDSSLRIWEREGRGTMIKLYGHVALVTYSPIFCFDFWFTERGILHLERADDSKIGGEVIGAK